jgi:hypothetical protein
MISVMLGPREMILSGVLSMRTGRPRSSTNVKSDTGSLHAVTREDVIITKNATAIRIDFITKSSLIRFKMARRKDLHVLILD